MEVIPIDSQKRFQFIIGIDPGKTGGIVGLEKDTGSIAFMEPMPTFGGKDNPFNPSEFYITIKRRRNVEHIFLEMAQAFRGQGITSTFNYSRDYGIIIGILTAAQIPFTLVKPKTWQKEMHKGTLLSVDPKIKARQIAQRLWPSVSFLKTQRSKIPHDGMIDAALIAEYGRRLLK